MRARFVIKEGVECPNCGYLNKRQKECYGECRNCKMPYTEPQQDEVDLVYEEKRRKEGME